MAKPFIWNPDKNEWLKQERGFGFEDVVAAIESGALLDDLPNPSSAYPDQRLLIVLLDAHAVVVPYVTEAEHRFLKTAFPSRKATKLYQGRPK